MRIFALMNTPILDVIFEKLRQRTYIKGSKILNRDGLIEKMFFIVRGKLQSKGEDGVVTDLCEGDVCGEELLAWCFEDSSSNKGKFFYYNEKIFSFPMYDGETKTKTKNSIIYLLQKGKE